jgi:nicotinamide mononucleotide transporter
MSSFRYWEISAVLSSLLYTYLIGIGSIWCWAFALYSGVVFTILCYKRKIYAETALHVFYFFAGLYGWYHWGAHEEKGFNHSLSLNFHLGVIVLLLSLSLGSGYALKKYTDAKLTYLDSSTTIFSIWATILMVNLIVDNWMYFLVINAAAFFLYLNRKMYPTAALMVIYVFLSIKGYNEWMQM